MCRPGVPLRQEGSVFLPSLLPSSCELKTEKPAAPVDCPGRNPAGAKDMGVPKKGHATPALRSSLLPWVLRGVWVGFRELRPAPAPTKSV